MARGRPRKSAKEKLLEGSHAKISVEIFKPTGLPFVPDHLAKMRRLARTILLKTSVRRIFPR